VDQDLTLIESLQAGDQNAMDELMRRHQEALFHFVHRYLGNEASARDAVQETFVRVYFKAPAFRPRSTVKTWIYTIALNLCRDAARKLARQPGLLSLDEPVGESETPREVPDTGPSPDVEAEQEDQLDRLRAAIARLPDQLKSALVLFVLEQRSQKEVAEILGTTPKTVELRVFRAKTKLRELLGRENQ
jgi:RNA polymerase sigma-70 factor (ECF subfamily)